MRTSSLPRLLSASLLVVTVFLTQALGATSASASTAAVTTGNAVLGSTITVTSTFGAPAKAANYIVDTEVFAPSGARVAQFFETVWLGGSTSRTYSWNTAGLVAGTYRFQQGVFTLGWNTLNWNANAGSVTLSDQGTPTTWALSGTTAGTGLVKVQSTFTAPTNLASTAVQLDTEVQNAAGQKVAQWAEPAAISGGQTLNRTYTWNTTSFAPGTYKIRQFVFAKNWSSKYASDKGSDYVISAPATTTTTAPVTTTTTAAPVLSGSPSWNLNSSVSGGTRKSIVSTFVASNVFTGGNVQLDTEVYNAAGAKVAQWTDSQWLSANQSASKTYTWDAVAATPGTYTVRQGVFSNDWSATYAWNANSTSVKISELSSASAPVTTTTAAPTPVAIGSDNPLVSSNGFYVSSWSQAKDAANSRRSWDATGASLLDKIAAGGAANWIGSWNNDVRGDVNAIVSAASQQQQTPVLVAYNIPGRDCGSYSAGGAAGSDAYRSWIASFAAGINGRKAAVILEPDALAQLDCLSPSGQADRLSLLRGAVATLSNVGASVYLDAGHANWISAPTMASRLQSAGIANARGFSLNVSNYETTAANATFGEAISALTGGSHYVVDTSRNGNGSNGEWCNPSGRALGKTPTTNTGIAHADGFIWIKQPGESDGTCNGGPSAGQFWADYAIGLASR